MQLLPSVRAYLQGGPTKVVPTVTIKNVSWYNFSWATGHPVYMGSTTLVQQDIPVSNWGTS